MVGEMIAIIVCVLVYALGWLLWPIFWTWFKRRKPIK